MTRRYRIRLVTTLIILLVGAAIPISQQLSWPTIPTKTTVPEAHTAEMQELDKLTVKGRAPKTGYARVQFGDGWTRIGVCDMRNIILARDLRGEIVDANCKVLSGTLDDPYSGRVVKFVRGPETSDDVQIDHIVALSNAWQTGAQYMSYVSRQTLANDPLNLLAVDGTENQNKSDGDAATWLPPNKSFRCQYVERQVEVKNKYSLWITPAEKQAMRRVLAAC